MVVTISLADLACDGSTSPPEDTSGEVAPPGNPPAPQPEPAPTPDSGEQPDGPAPAIEPTTDKPAAAHVELQPNGTCLEYPEVECPKDPNVSCNPPGPIEVPCPESVYPEATNPKNVSTRPDGSCWETRGGNFECPKGAVCNPPPPRRVQCVGDGPEGV